MENTQIKLNDSEINALNEKVIQSQLFTPDRVYIEMGLLKDFPIGVMYTDKIVIQDDPEGFAQVQATVNEVVEAYENRRYETIDPYFASIGYTDGVIDEMLSLREYHDSYFLISPNTRFFNTLIRHTIRNQNNSRPANKYNKKSIGEKHYILEPVPVTYLFNTYPLFLSKKCMELQAVELGESFGVNIEFMCKNPSEFDNTDWDTWMKHIDCFYIDSMHRFTQSPMVIEKQGELETVGSYLFGRKRFGKSVMGLCKDDEDFDNQVAMITSVLDVYYEFNWLQNNQVRLSDEPEVVEEIPEPLV
jgi:hypothetical protein